MSILVDRIQNDLKVAMLARETLTTTVLRGIKSAILYVEVAEGKRGEGLTDDQVMAVLAKEAKKRQESILLYKQGGDTERAEQEASELKIIQAYLPQQMTEEEIISLVDTVIQDHGSVTLKDMGQIISQTREKSAGAADGAIIARVVKERIGQ